MTRSCISRADGVQRGRCLLQILFGGELLHLLVRERQQLLGPCTNGRARLCFLMAAEARRVIREVYENPNTGFSNQEETLRQARLQDRRVTKQDVREFFERLKVREDRPQRGYASCRPNRCTRFKSIWLTWVSELQAHAGGDRQLQHCAALRCAALRCAALHRAAVLYLLCDCAALLRCYLSLT